MKPAACSAPNLSFALLHSLHPVLTTSPGTSSDLSDMSVTPMTPPTRVPPKLQAPDAATFRLGAIGRTPSPTRPVFVLCRSSAVKLSSAVHRCFELKWNTDVQCFSPIKKSSENNARQVRSVPLMIRIH